MSKKSCNKFVNYEYHESDIDYSQTTFYPGGTWEAEHHCKIPPGNILKISDISKNVERRVLAGIEGYNEYGNLGIVKVEPEDKSTASGEIIFYFVPWGGDYGLLNTKYYELCAIAQQNPKKAIVLVDSPMAGKSKPMEPFYYAKMIDDGNFGAYADYVYSDVAKLINGYNIAHICGVSLGACLATSIIPQVADEVNNTDITLNVFESLNNKIGLKRLLIGFLLTENYCRKKYLKYVPSDEKEIFGKNKCLDGKELFKNIGERALGIVSQFGLFPYIMSQNDLTDLTDAITCSAKVKEVNLGYGGMSALTNVDEVIEMVHKIYDDAQEGPKETITNILNFEKLTHAVTSSGLAAPTILDYLLNQKG